MATVFIHSGNRNFYEMCKSYFSAYGYSTVEGPEADVVILDLDYGKVPTVPGARLLVLVSAKEYHRHELPENAVFQLKPVDVDAMVDRIMKILNG